MKKLVLVAPHLVGHHASYLHIYSSIFLDMGLSLVILCDDVNYAENYLGDVVRSHQENLEIYKLHKTVSRKLEEKLRTKKGAYRDLLETYISIKNFNDIRVSLKNAGVNDAQFVLILWLDSYISKYLISFTLPFFFPYLWGGLFFHPVHKKYDHKKQVSYYDTLYYMMIFRCKNLRFIGLFDENIVGRLSARYKRDVFHLLPDVAIRQNPGPGSSIVRLVEVQAKGRKIVALLGGLGKRKNLLRFLELVTKCEDDKVFFLCVGAFPAEVYSASESNYIYEIAEEYKHKLFFHDCRIESDVEFDALFNMSDVIFAVYNRFYSNSNMITKSAIYSKYIVVANDYLMCSQVQKYEMGYCVDPSDSAEILQAICKLLFDDHGLKPRFGDYLEDNSLESLKFKLQNILDFC